MSLWLSCKSNIFPKCLKNSFFHFLTLCLPPLPPSSTVLSTFCFLFFKFFSSFIFISWRLITSQYCSGFCHTLTWISHGFTCISHPNLLTLLISHSCVNMTYYNCLLLKSHWRARFLEMKVCFIFDAGTWCRGREGCVPAQRLTLPHYPTPPHPAPPHR